MPIYYENDLDSIKKYEHLSKEELLSILINETKRGNIENSKLLNEILTEIRRLR